jgi:hypothetical protein
LARSDSYERIVRERRELRDVGIVVMHGADPSVRGVRRTSCERRSGAATEIVKLTPNPIRTAESRTLLDHASARTRAKATSTAKTSIHDTPIKADRPTVSKPNVLARAVAHEGAETPTGSRTGSGDCGAPATTAIAR